MLISDEIASKCLPLEDSSNCSFILSARALPVDSTSSLVSMAQLSFCSDRRSKLGRFFGGKDQVLTEPLRHRAPYWAGEIFIGF